METVIITGSKYWNLLAWYSPVMCHCCGLIGEVGCPTWGSQASWGMLPFLPIPYPIC